jgi:hypothetical protein
VIGRGAGRLDDEDVGTADVFIDFDEGFAVRDSGDVDIGEGLAEGIGDAFGEGAMGGATDEFHGKWDKMGGFWRRRRIVDSGCGVGNTLLVNPSIPRRTHA